MAWNRDTINVVVRLVFGRRHCTLGFNRSEHKLKKNKRLIAKKQQTKQSSSIFRSMRSYLRKNADIGTIVGITFSIIALGISYRSCDTADKAFEYTIRKDLVEKSPSIEFRLESGTIYSELNKESARLQAVMIKFPDSIQSRIIVLDVPNLQFRASTIENVVWKFYECRLNPNTTETLITVPIVVDFEAIVDKKAVIYREDHFLYFDLLRDNDGTHRLKYSTHRFNFTHPHSQSFEPKDKLELQDYINRRFAESQAWDRYTGLIR